jgi:hypothetical protein
MLTQKYGYSVASFHVIKLTHARARVFMCVCERDTFISASYHINVTIVLSGISSLLFYMPPNTSLSSVPLS